MGFNVSSSLYEKEIIEETKKDLSIILLDKNENSIMKLGQIMKENNLTENDL